MRDTDHPWIPVPEAHFDALRTASEGHFWHVARVRWAARLIERWVHRAGTRRPYHFVDLGSGVGGFARDLKALLRPERSLLVDIHPGVAGIARDLAMEGRRVDFSGAWELPWPANLATCMDVLEHLPDDVAFLRTVREQLSPGSLLVLSVPAHPGLYSEWDRRIGHLRRYRFEELRGKVEQAGFVVVEQRYMWSILVPAAWVRRLRKHRAGLSFPPNLTFLNRLFLALSDLEWHLPTFLRPPWGTSIVLCASRH